MLVELLIGGWLLKSCLIAGEVVWSEQNAAAKLSAQCPVSYEVDRSLLRIRSKKWIVEIPIPHETGSQSFEYHWGQTKAVVGNHIVEISYGPAGEI
ncbi:MAG TPA: hypothetical protein PKA61_13410 [Nitrospira sp.]|nr:hypothetical protein [Nitrospira sp.]